ncbi:MAG TPA: hypothetical protein VHR45_09825 [Thermoanaerobaculia bacterium]|nr:hypothetical protein [Thermoanaerobaculia bacterium]
MQLFCFVATISAAAAAIVVTCIAAALLFQIVPQARPLAPFILVPALIAAGVVAGSWGAGWLAVQLLPATLLPFWAFWAGFQLGGVAGAFAGSVMALSIYQRAESREQPRV